MEDGWREAEGVRRTKRTDAQRFLARKTQTFCDDAGPRHHDRRTIDDGGLVLERTLVQNLVKVEAAQRDAFVRSFGPPCQVLVPDEERRRRGDVGGAGAFAPPLLR